MLGLTDPAPDDRVPSTYAVPALDLPSERRRLSRQGQGPPRGGGTPGAEGEM